MEYSTSNSVALRAVSGFPLSVGTSLAFESVFPATQTPYDPERTIPNQVLLDQYQTCWVNVSTLFRNLISAVDKQAFLQATIQELAMVIEEEIGVIQSLFDEYGKGCKVEFYYSDYSQIKSELKRGKIVFAELREPNTENQKFYQSRLNDVIKQINQHSDSLHVFKGALEAKSYESAFVLTHQPFDLTEYDKFGKLDLLESNTGLLKPRTQWNTKYHSLGKEDLSHLPFNRTLLFVFGDKVLIKPLSIKIREQILAISVKRNWTPATTLEKVYQDFTLEIRDPALFAVLKSYR